MAAEQDRNKIVQINGKTICIQYLEGESRAERSRDLSQKLIPPEEISTLGDFFRRRNKKIAFTTGAYDVIHKGHGRYLHLARSLGDILVVGLNSDSSIRGYKGPDRPIQSQEDRAEMLSFLESVDYLTIYEELTGAAVIRKLKPDAYLCVEGSWEGDIAAKEEVIAIAETGGQVFFTPRQDPFMSTTNIIEKIGDIYGRKILEDYKRMMEQQGQNGR